MDWVQIGKGALQGCILSPYLFKLYAKYIMRNAVLDEAQAVIKIARRNISNLLFLIFSSVQSLSRVHLFHFMANKRGNCGNSERLYFDRIKGCLLLERKAMIKLDSILKSRDITLPTKFCVQSYGF